MGALSQLQLERIIEDIRNEPPWRAEASREMDLYDGNQLESAVIQKMRELGMMPSVVNLIGPTIDAVTGLEGRTRSDPIVTAEGDENTDAAEALNQKHKEATRLCKYNRACSDAFGHQVKVGLGWVEVSRNADAFGYPYRLAEVNRKEMWYDWRARAPDLEDARFIVRRKWYDADDLETHFPEQAEIIRQAINQRPSWENLDDDIQTPLMRAWSIEQGTTLQEEEWRDTLRKRLALYEVWYKTFHSIQVLKLPDGRVVEFDKKNPRHVEAVAAGLITPQSARTHRIRVAYYVGPHQISDEPSPYPHNRFPYVPFFGKREDRTGIPYGLIRPMKSPQEEVNARRTKMMHNLATRRTIIDEDAVDDHKKTAAEIARSDAYVVLRKDRQRENALTIDAEEGINRQQYELLLESKGNVQEATGLFHEFLGRSQSGDQSGEAIKNLIEQGAQVLGELMDNYRDSRRLVAELLLSLIVEDISRQNDVEVKVKKAGGVTKKVVLNGREHGDESTVRSNDVTRLRTHVALNETASSVTYRQQVLQRLMELTESLPDEMKPAMVKFLILATDIPDREEIVKEVMAMAGQQAPPEEPTTPEEAAAQQEAMAAEQAEQQRQADLMRRSEDAEVAEREAKAAKTKADAALTEAKARKLMDSDTRLTEAQIVEILRGIQRDDLHEGAELTEKGARLMNEQDRQQREDAMQAQQGTPGPRQSPAPVG